ncbi:unnamed protein product [Schistosoma mattheei]|uniref:Uncharacterized protein n=1 Tax=Schistosoma mattheei TaxID=31246 RepID=A0A183NWQ0_9TREM|nr:unnamed protein product [Schistosoma mattheei]
MKRMNRNWKELERTIQDRVGCRLVVGGLCHSTKGKLRGDSMSIGILLTIQLECKFVIVEDNDEKEEAENDDDVDNDDDNDDDVKDDLDGFID